MITLKVVMPLLVPFRHLNDSRMLLRVTMLLVTAEVADAALHGLVVSSVLQAVLSMGTRSSGKRQQLAAAVSATAV